VCVCVCVYVCIPATLCRIVPVLGFGLAGVGVVGTIEVCSWGEDCEERRVGCFLRGSSIKLLIKFLHQFNTGKAL
jgi:hypothetical protein